MLQTSQFLIEAVSSLFFKLSFDYWNYIIAGCCHWNLKLFRSGFGVLITPFVYHGFCLTLSNGILLFNNDSVSTYQLNYQLYRTNNSVTKVTYPKLSMVSTLSCHTTQEKVTFIISLLNFIKLTYYKFRNNLQFKFPNCSHQVHCSIKIMWTSTSF